VGSPGTLRVSSAKTSATRRPFRFRSAPHVSAQSPVTLRHSSSMTPVKRSRAEQARQYLTGGAVLREDSDDELGYEDHPWEWIYDEHANDDSAANSQDGTPRKRKAAAYFQERRIVGARMGNFRCSVGDAVLLKAEGNHAWVGIICEFIDDLEEEEKMARFLWFASEQEIRNQSKKRTDFLPVRTWRSPHAIRS
jgi:origin recognition complex subunit 1